MRFFLSIALLSTSGLFIQTAAFATPLSGVSQASSSSSVASSSARSQKTLLNANFFDNLFGNNKSGNGSSMPSTYTIAITGASGLIGTALRDELSKRETVNGKSDIRIVQLKRGSQAETFDPEDCTTLMWNPSAETSDEVIDPAALKAFDAIVHLAGENISTGLGSSPLAAIGIQAWSDAKKQEILNSRIITTTALANAIKDSKTKLSFLVSSGVGIYGDTYMGTNAEAATEATDVSNTPGFLAEVSRKWEDATQGAGGSRVVNMRTGIVMSKKGGALAKLFPIFFVGGGGNVGSGEQCFPVISARDMARAIIHTLETPSLKGPVNMCVPEGCTNAEFTKALGSVLKRPTILPFPAFAVNALFGEMGNEVLLGGTKAVPTKLLQSGFEFQHPTVQEAVQSAVNETI